MRATRPARENPLSRPRPPILIDLTATTGVGQGGCASTSGRTSSTSNPPGDVVVVEHVRRPDTVPNPVDEERRSLLRSRVRSEIEAEFEARIKNLEEENRKLKSDKDEFQRLLNSKDVALRESAERANLLENEVKSKDTEISHLNGLVELKESTFKRVVGINANLQEKIKELRGIRVAEREQTDLKHSSLLTENKTIQMRLDNLNERFEKLKKKQTQAVAGGAEMVGKRRSQRRKPDAVVPNGRVQLESNEREQDHQFESQATVEVFRCSCGERFVSKQSLHLHTKRFNGAATLKCPKEACGDVFYTENHLKAHTCKVVVDWSDVGHPMTWKTGARVKLPFISFEKERMDDQDYVKQRIKQILGSGTDQL